MRLRIIGKLGVLSWLLLLMLLSVAHAQPSASPKRVLVLSWYNKDHPWNTLFDQGFQAVLQTAPAGTTVETYSEYLESNRFPGEHQSRLLRDYLKQKYADRTIDVVVANSDASLDFLLKYRADLFPQAPVVFIATRHPSQEDLATGSGLTGFINLNKYRENLDLILSLHPGTKRVFIISGTLEHDKRFETLARNDLQDYESKVELVYLTDLSRDELNTRMMSLPEGSIVFHVWQQSRNEQGRVIEHPEMLSAIARSATAPVYAMNPITVFSLSEDSIEGSGLIGGLIVTPEASGTKVAEFAQRIANGARASDIPLEAAPTVPMFDWRELRRWGIDERRLPAGSIVRYRKPTLWEQYKWRIVGAVALIILQALLIAWLLFTRARRRKAEKESERFARVAQAEHQRLDEVVSNVPGLVWEVSIDPDSGKRKTSFVSRFVEQMLGFNQQDFLGKPGFGLSLVPEEDRERVERETNEIFATGQSGTIQYRWLTKSARLIWVEAQIAVMRDEHDKPIGLRGVTMDITDRMRAGEALRESEHRFQLVSQTTKDVMYDWDVQTGSVWWNDSAMGSVFGYPLEEMRHHINWWEERLHPEDKARIDLSEILGGPEQMWELEYRFRKMDNSYAYVYERAFIVRNEEGKALRVIGSLMDFSERKQFEEKLRSALEEVNLLKNQLQEENIYLQEEIKLAHNVDEIIGRSNAIKYVLFKIEQVSKPDSTVMILGETGTGKELVARAIHSQSLRQDRPLVKVNCAALSASLIESELFGHEKGSFTGASARKIGRFELADGATLFLDEIGELPLDLQSKLLRVIQEGEFERLGSSKTVKVDVRIIAATNRNMKIEIDKGAFREDLWYRLNVFPITVPPLRQRKEDIPPMVEHFVNSLSRKVGKNITAVSSATLKKLQDYSWPGNVRELANVIERGVINAQGPVLHLAEQFEQPQSQDLAGPSRTLDEIEKDYITRILADTAWKIEGPNGAAKILGLNPSTLRTRMVKLGIQKSVHSSAQG